jgi:hypothetical protein
MPIPDIPRAGCGITSWVAIFAGLAWFLTPPGGYAIILDSEGAVRI